MRTFLKILKPILILQNIDIDEISYWWGFGILSTPGPIPQYLKLLISGTPKYLQALNVWKPQYSTPYVLDTFMACSLNLKASTSSPRPNVINPHFLSGFPSSLSFSIALTGLEHAYIWSSFPFILDSTKLSVTSTMKNPCPWHPGMEKLWGPDVSPLFAAEPEFFCRTAAAAVANGWQGRDGTWQGWHFYVSFHPILLWRSS